MAVTKFLLNSLFGFLTFSSTTGTVSVFKKKEYIGFSVFILICDPFEVLIELFSDGVKGSKLDFQDHIELSCIKQTLLHY